MYSKKGRSEYGTLSVDTSMCPYRVVGVRVTPHTPTLIIVDCDPERWDDADIHNKREHTHGMSVLMPGTPTRALLGTQRTQRSRTMRSRMQCPSLRCHDIPWKFWTQPTANSSSAGGTYAAHVQVHLVCAILRSRSPRKSINERWLQPLSVLHEYIFPLRLELRTAACRISWSEL